MKPARVVVLRAVSVENYEKEPKLVSNLRRQRRPCVLDGPRWEAGAEGQGQGRFLADARLGVRCLIEQQGPLIRAQR